jgi:hypothetical protein
MAQHPAILPIAPVVPRVQPAAPVLRGVDIVPFPAAQSASPTQSEDIVYQQPVPRPDPLYILNSAVIIDNSFRNIMPNDIAKLDVYKGGPDTPWQWRSLTANGIISITLKDKRKVQMQTKTLAQIGKWLHVSGPVSYSINGMPVGESDLRIATVAIGEMKVTRATAAAPTTSVNIQIAHHIPPPPAPDPSGKPRIMIRGTAAL